MYHQNKNLNISKVFISGSIKIRRINWDIKCRLNKILSKNYLILLGDANGVDKAVQEYLTERKYCNVIIYCVIDSLKRYGKNIWSYDKLQSSDKLETHCNIVEADSCG